MSSLGLAAGRAVAQDSTELDITWTLNSTQSAGAHVHLTMQGRYVLAATKNGPASCGIGPVGNLSALDDRQTFCWVLNYVNGSGQLLEGGGNFGANQFTLVDNSGPPATGVVGALRGMGKGRALLRLAGGPDYKVASPDQQGTMEEAMGCTQGVPDLAIGYAQVRALGRLDTAWTQPSYPPELEGCSGGWTIHIRGICHSRGLQLFQAMMPVFTHPRCINCHGVVNPSTGANHPGGKVEAEVGEAANQPCLGCHDEDVGEMENPMTHKTRPVGPWILAPAELSFVGKDAAALCKQVRANSNAGLAFHAQDDQRIKMGFEGLGGGAVKTPAPPPMSQSAFVKAAIAWVETGHQSCGCGDPGL